MGDNKTSLFSEFSGVDFETWVKKIEKDLKGKPIDSLYFKPEFDLEAKAYYHPNEFTNQVFSNQSNLKNNNNDWYITEQIVDKDSKTSNAIILDKLNRGATGVKIVLTENSNFEVLLKDVLLEYVFSHFVLNSITQCLSFSEFIKGKKIVHCNLELPIFTKGLSKGHFDFSANEILKLNKTDLGRSINCFSFNGSDFGDFGASTIQELALILAQAHECFQMHQSNDIDIKTIGESIALNVSINSDYFVNIAKFRAIRELMLQLYDQWAIDKTNLPWINGITGIRNISKNDRHNNLLRQTTEAMSAVLGGANSILVSPYSAVTNSEIELSERLSRNIQLVLKDEAYFDKVIDPGAGSYYIEHLTDQLIDKSWKLFMEIESKGGYYAAIKSNDIQNIITHNKTIMREELNNNAKTLLGVNKYPNGTEKWQNSIPEEVNNTGEFEAFQVFRLENHFEKPVA